MDVLCVRMHTHLSTWYPQRPREGKELPGLELQTIVSHYARAGIKPRTSGRAANALYH